jgi:iron complex transport system permease protein
LTTRPKQALLWLGLATLVIGILSLSLGAVGLPTWNILLSVRFPRILLGLLVGLGLAGSGAVFQGVLRNPLADPFILGTSSAATAGVMIANLVGIHNYYLLYSLALGFALMSIMLVYQIALIDGKSPVQTLVLAGVIVSLFFNALVFIVFSLFYRESFNVLFYLLGTLTSADPLLIIVSGILILVSFGTSWLLSRELNVLTQGEEVAFHLGVEVETAKRILFVAASTMVGACVAVAGMIGFVGLIVPHMMRMIVGPDHRYLLPASALSGAILLMVTDALARTLAPPLEIPVGALTALLGAPYFVYLLRRRQQAGEF